MIKVIFDIKYTNYSDLSEDIFIVYDKDGEYYYLLDSVDKIKDVEKMPQYIKEDYYNYKTEIRQFTEDELDKIVTIRRELNLKEIL